MRSYFKVAMHADGKTLTPTVTPGQSPLFKALMKETHKATACGKYNLISGSSFGGQSWFLINGPTQFDPVIISFTCAQLANSLFTIIPYADHPLD